MLLNHSQYIYIYIFVLTGQSFTIAEDEELTAITKFLSLTEKLFCKKKEIKKELVEVSSISAAFDERQDQKARSYLDIFIMKLS